MRKCVFKLFVISLLSLVNCATYSQTLMPLPPHGSTYIGNSRGYWFTAPTNFIITGLRVPTDASTSSQNIQVINLDSVPPFYTAVTNNFTSLVLFQNVTGTAILPVNIPVNTGDIIGIFGTRGTTNSYATAPYVSSISGIPVTLTRLGFQDNLSTISAYDVWQTATGSISRVEMYYVLNTLNLSITNDTSICTGDSVSLSVDTLGSTTLIPPYSYAWTPSTGLSCDTCQSTFAQPASTTTYTVVVTDSAGTQDSIAVDITVVSSVPTALAGNDTSICPGDSAQLSASGGFTYSWSPGTGLSDSTIANPMSGPAVTTTYVVTASNGCGSDTDTMEVSVVMLTASFTEVSTDLIVTFTNTSSGSTSYFWDFGDGFQATISDPVHTYTANGPYNVCLITTNACGSDTFCTNVTVTLGGCNNTVAAFDTITVDLTAVFTDISTDATAWAWDFGDGGNSAVQNPVYTYAAAGTYNVCLVTTNPCSSDTTCMMVTVGTPCTPTVAGFTSNSVGLDVVFNDVSSDATSWSWDFGDASTSTDQNPVHTYVSAGTYTVCLIVTNPCSADTSCSNITVTVCVTPVASFTSLSSDLTVTFSDASSNTTSWSWDFGDGNTSNDPNPTYSYSAAGTYNVCLTANSGCATDVMCDSVTVMAVGLEEPGAFAEMQVYPNPTDGMLNITIPAIVNEDITFIMYNVLGEIVFKAQQSDLNTVNGPSVQNKYSMDIGYLANGMYLLQLLTDHDAHMEQIVISK